MSVRALEEFTRRHYQLARFPVAASRGIIILVSPRRLVYIVKHTRQVMVSISSLVCEFMVVMMIRLLNLTFDSNLVCILYYYHKENVVFHSLKPMVGFASSVCLTLRFSKKAGEQILRCPD